MADFQTALDNILMARAGLTALIGDRLYPNGAPPDPALPYIVWYEFATPREATFGNAAAVSKPRIQYSIYARGYGAAKAIAKEIRAAVNGCGYPIVIEDERGNREATSGINRRDVDVRFSHDGD